MRLILFHFILIPSLAFAQEERHTDSSNNDGSFHNVTLLMANTLVPNSFANNTGDVIVVPTFGFNYDYQFNSTW